MEMLAEIVGLEALKERCQLTLYSDSESTRPTKARPSAGAKGWMRTANDPARNPDLW